MMVGSIIATALFATLLNLVTLVGICFNNYFLVYLFLVVSILHSVANLLIAINFPLLYLVVLLQLILSMVAYCYVRQMRAGPPAPVEYCSKHVANLQRSPETDPNEYTVLAIQD